jgi:ADP-ribosylglycohydrolase
VALGFFVAHDGAFLPTVLGAVNYGRDSDSIASMAGSLAAGIGGQAVIPSDILDTIATASRVDFDEYATLLSDIATDIMQKDAARAEADLRRVSALQGA